MKIKKPIILILFLAHFYSLGSETRGSRVYQTKGMLDHPFKINDPEEKYDIHTLMMHINTNTRDEKMDEDIYFLISKIEETNTTIAGINTDHFTKKLILDPQKKSLKLIGKKLLHTDEMQKSWLSKDELSQIITPRKIAWAKKEDVQYTKGLDTLSMLQTNETEYFCTTLQEKYRGPVAITLARFKPNSGFASNRNVNTDNFPCLGYELVVYCEPNTWKQEKTQTSPTKINSPDGGATANTPNSKTAKSFLTSNRIITISFASLMACFLVHYFFEINIHIKLRQT